MRSPGVGEQVPHLDADERLAPACGRLGHVDVDAVVRCTFVLEEHLPFDLDRFDQGCHEPIHLTQSRRRERQGVRHRS